MSRKTGTPSNGSIRRGLQQTVKAGPTTAQLSDGTLGRSAKNEGMPNRLVTPAEPESEAGR
ncbi:hypothetical protein [Amycolatopsis sp. NPDC051903]|uniref:hypothetical protein n=1 Tax=Amycolatopsis sp. NPDC051903 TaxID=3363936 RepID=UPI0037A48DF3